MSERMKWRLFFAYSYAVGVLTVVGVFVVTLGAGLRPHPLRSIGRIARHHADIAYPAGNR